MYPSLFPNPVPQYVYVPHWAILDITNENIWNVSKAYAAGGQPEYGPGALFGPSGVSTSPAPTPSHTGGHGGMGHGGMCHGGAIASGVVAGIAGISITVSVILYIKLRRLRAVSAGVGASQPVPDDGVPVQSPPRSPLTMNFYDPNNRTTFPMNQGGQVPLNRLHAGSKSTLEDARSVASEH